MVQCVEWAGPRVAAARRVEPPAQPYRLRRPGHAGASGRGRADAAPIHARRGSTVAVRCGLLHARSAVGQSAAGRAIDLAVVVRATEKLRILAGGAEAVVTCE